MPFEAKKTKFTVFTLNYELCNLIKRALNMKCESKSTQTYTYQNPGRELIYSFLKVCIVLKLGEVCGPLPKTLTPFMTKICHFPYPIYDLTKNLILYL